jgi:hypothetical protein
MTTVQYTINGPFSPPPCSAAHIDPLLNEDHANAVNPAPEPARCRFLSSDKRQRLMLRADRHPHFCLFSPKSEREARRLMNDIERLTPPHVNNAECALPQARSQPAQNVQLQNHST